MFYVLKQGYFLTNKTIQGLAVHLFIIKTIFSMRIFFICLLFTPILFMSSCKKKPSAGYGGNANLKLFAKHHGAAIDNVTFYIKFNATDVPVGGVYDITQTAIVYSAGNSYASISGLKKGDYYIYAKGWDSSISEEVKGAIPYTITDETSQDIIVAVSE